MVPSARIPTVAVTGVVATVVVGGLLAADYGPALVIGAITGASYGLLALGLVLIHRSSKVFNFAQGEFGTVGVYLAAAALGAGLPYPLAAMLGVVSAAAMGRVTYQVVVRPLRSTPRVTTFVATAAVALLAIGVQTWLAEPRPRSLPAAAQRLDRVQVGGVMISDQRLLLLLAAVVLAGGLAYFFSRTTLGLAVQASSRELLGAELVGIDTDRVARTVWTMAGALGGVAGILVAPLTGYFPGFLTSEPLVAAMTAAVVGGFASLRGAFVGGVLVGVIQSVATASPLASVVPGVQVAAVFLLLVAVLLVRPHGLVGSKA